MRATILPYAIILTKAQRATARMMAKGSIVARVLPFFTIQLNPCLCHYSAIFLYLDK